MLRVAFSLSPSLSPSLSLAGRPLLPSSSSCPPPFSSTSLFNSFCRMVSSVVDAAPGPSAKVDDPLAVAINDAYRVVGKGCGSREEALKVSSSLSRVAHLLVASPKVIVAGSEGEGLTWEDQEGIRAVFAFSSREVFNCSELSSKEAEELHSHTLEMPGAELVVRLGALSQSGGGDAPRGMNTLGIRLNVKLPLLGDDEALNAAMNQHLARDLLQLVAYDKPPEGRLWGLTDRAAACERLARMPVALKRSEGLVAFTPSDCPSVFVFFDQTTLLQWAERNPAPEEGLGITPVPLGQLVSTLPDDYSLELSPHADEALAGWWPELSVRVKDLQVLKEVNTSPPSA